MRFQRTVTTMRDSHRFVAGIDELKRAEEIVRELHAGCCEPLRSPRMEALSETIKTARMALVELEDDRDSAAVTIGLLEDAGAQLGHLQVACCSPAGTKLYASALASLGRTQRLIKSTLDLEH